MSSDEYTKLTIPDGAHIEACPCCGSTPELWQYQVSEGEAASKAVMCTNNERIGPQDGVADEGCPLYMPSQGFYRATIREAIKYWNEYAKALMKQQRQNRWKTAQFLRAQTAQQAGG